MNSNYENHKEWYVRYRKTPFGLISRMACNHRSRSKLKGFPPPRWNAKELYVYAMNDSVFLRLFYNWVKSGYDWNLTPTVDRKDSSLPYTWENIQFLTNRENRWVKGCRERKLQVAKPVCMISTEDGCVLKEFSSMNDAAKEGFPLCNVKRCIDGIASHCGGYQWDYSL